MLQAYGSEKHELKELGIREARGGSTHERGGVLPVGFFFGELRRRCSLTLEEREQVGDSGEEEAAQYESAVCRQ